MPPRAPRIEVLSIKDRFYVGDDQDDGKGIRIKSTKFQVDKGVFMSTASIFALALTERCCEVGKGKVLCNLRQDLTGKDLPSSITTANALLPDLIYFPTLWTKSQQTEYKSLKHHTRLQLLNAQEQDSILLPTMLVLPIQLIVQSNPSANVPEKPISTSNNVGAMMLHLPETYLGYAQDFPLVSEAKAGVADTAQQAPRFLHISDPALQALRYRSGDMLVNRLEEMYAIGVVDLMQGGTLQGHRNILEEVNAVAEAIRSHEDGEARTGGEEGNNGVPGGLLGEYIL